MKLEAFIVNKDDDYMRKSFIDKMLNKGEVVKKYFQSVLTKKQLMILIL